MPKPPTKSSGIRMPVELYNWIDRLAARRGMNRSQCVCALVEKARRSLAPKAKPEQPWTVHAAKAGEYLSVVIIMVDVQCMFGVL